MKEAVELNQRLTVVLASMVKHLPATSGCCGSLPGVGRIVVEQRREVPLTNDELKRELQIAFRRLKLRTDVSGGRDNNERLDVSISGGHGEDFDRPSFNDSSNDGDELHSGDGVRVDRNPVDCHCCLIHRDSPSVVAPVIGAPDASKATVGDAVGSADSPSSESAAPSGVYQVSLIPDIQAFIASGSLRRAASEAEFDLVLKDAARLRFLRAKAASLYGFSRGTK